MNAAWLSTLAKKSKRKGNVLERVRKMSLSYVFTVYILLDYQICMLFV